MPFAAIERFGVESVNNTPSVKSTHITASPDVPSSLTAVTLPPPLTVKLPDTMLLSSMSSSKVTTSRVMETKHRSVLVFDEKGAVNGILTMTGLISSIMPAYLSAPKPSMADSIVYSPMFWKGNFTREIKKLARIRIKEIMSPAPLIIEGEANLMEAAYTMLSNRVNRLLVMKQGAVVGVVRDLDLFFEMDRILRE